MPYASQVQKLEYQREYRQRPEVKARDREYRREYQRRPDVVARRKARQNDYQRRYRGKPEVAERTLDARRGQARKHEKTYWPRFRLACRLAKERGDRHLSPEHLAAVGLKAPTLTGETHAATPPHFAPTLTPRRPEVVDPGRSHGP